MSTRDQPGHELVKTEAFIVPVGTSVVVTGLEFDSIDCALTAEHQRILTQVFNSLEEITENTLGDADPGRVAAFRKMQFEIRGYSANLGHDRTVSRNCAERVRTFLTNLGTPAWRLSAKGLGDRKSDGQPAVAERQTSRLRVEFTRTR